MNSNGVDFSEYAYVMKVSAGPLGLFLVKANTKEELFEKIKELREAMREAYH